MNQIINKTFGDELNIDVKTNKDEISLAFRILIAIGCIIVVFLSIIGNSLVVTVIIRFKRLKNATNYILLSLAIADITVTFLVMLPATIQDVLQKWVFSKFFCKFYNASDITCCTASILHLLLVAIDRYIAIFKPLTYKNMVRKWHVFTAVVLVWTLSICMSFIPIFCGWNQVYKSNANDSKQSIDELTFNHTINEEIEICTLEANTTYALISSSLSFYIPLIIMTLVYIRIYIVAKRQANAIAQLDIRATSYTRNYSNSTTLSNQQNTIVSSNNQTSLVNNKSGSDLLNDQQLIEINNILNQNGEPRISDDRGDKKSRFMKMLRQIKSIERKRTKDTKAIKTLGIIMGIFIICWLPFFLMYVSIPLTNQPVPLFTERIITWVGYVNSFINPIIYALTNKDFRKSYISTLKSVSKKICPLLIYNYIFDSKDDYFSIAVNSESNSKNKNKLCCNVISSNISNNNNNYNKPRNSNNKNDKFKSVIIQNEDDYKIEENDKNNSKLEDENFKNNPKKLSNITELDKLDDELEIDQSLDNLVYLNNDKNKFDNNTNNQKSSSTSSNNKKSIYKLKIFNFKNNSKQNLLKKTKTKSKDKIISVRV